jgi:iron complex outermembrane receptor protein
VNIDYSCTTITTLDPREATFDRESFRIGDADSTQNSFVANEGYMMGPGEIYGFLTYSDRDNQSGGFTRTANNLTDTKPDKNLIGQSRSGTMSTGGAPAQRQHSSTHAPCAPA